MVIVLVVIIPKLMILNMWRGELLMEMLLLQFDHFILMVKCFFSSFFLFSSDEGLEEMQSATGEELGLQVISLARYTCNYNNLSGDIH